MNSREHRATADFWLGYEGLPLDIRRRADKQFALLKADPQHPSLQLKKVGSRKDSDIWSVRITLDYRALAMRRTDGYLWFWIGTHKLYDAILS